MTFDDPRGAMASDDLVPLYSSGSSDDLYSVAAALVNAGISTFEVTLRSPGSLEALRDVLKQAKAEELPLAIGAGTVLDVASAEAVIDAGARFVFSPVVSDEVASRCATEGVVYIPGCATPTEIHQALHLGCNTVKLFPANEIGGPGFLRSVRSVFPSVNCIPSGGIGPDATVIRRWFEAGAVAVAMGSQLLGKPALRTPEVQQRLELALNAIDEARREIPA